MNEINIVKQPGSLNELEEVAKRETFTRKGAEAVIESYAKRNNMTIEEAREKLGYKSVKAVKIQMGKGNLVGDGNGGVTNESVEKLLTKNESNQTTIKQTDPETTAQGAEDLADDDATLKQKEPFTVEEEPEPVSPIGMTDEKFDKLDDDMRIVVTAGMLRRFAHMIRAEERLKNKPITLNEMFDIAGEAS
ncbi:hypothetical protein [Hydrogenimonas sp.]